MILVGYGFHFVLGSHNGLKASGSRLTMFMETTLGRFRRLLAAANRMASAATSPSTEHPVSETTSTAVTLSPQTLSPILACRSVPIQMFCDLGIMSRKHPIIPARILKVLSRSLLMAVSSQPLSNQPMVPTPLKRSLLRRHSRHHLKEAWKSTRMVTTE